MFGVSAAATGKERNMLGMLSLLANMPWFQFNPLSLMNANKGVFGVNLGHLWGEIDRHARHGPINCWICGRKAPSSRRLRAAFRFDEAAQAHHFIQDRRNIGKVLLVP